MAVAKSRRDHLMIMIAGATGLRNADWSPFTQDKSDPYCICQLVKNPDVKIKTATIQNTLNPVWNHVERVTSYQKGDSLQFTVWDYDVGKRDDKLGHIRLSSSMFLPNGFMGKLQLQGSGNTTAALYVVVVPVPLCHGVLDVMRMSSLEPRYFSLNEEVLLYWTDAEDYETGAPERGSIVLADVERFEVDKLGTLIFHIYRLPQPLRVHCRDWEEAVKWSWAIERALLLRGFGSDKELQKLAVSPICEGLIRMSLEGKDGQKEDDIFVALLQDVIIGYKDYLTFRNNERQSLWVEPLSQITRVEAASFDRINLSMGENTITLITKDWAETIRWGSAFVRALEDADHTDDRTDKVDWTSFLTMVACEGSLDIIRGTGSLPRYFVLFGDHMAYYNSKEEYATKDGKQHGAVDFQHVTKVILGNDTTLTIKLVNGSLFQLRGLEAGQALQWADAWDDVLRARGMAPVIRFELAGNQFSWDFLTGSM